MGGPWRERGFDATTWRAPVGARTAELGVMSRADRADPLTPIVLGYIGGTLTSIAVLLIMPRDGW